MPAAALAGRNLRANPVYTLHGWEALPQDYRRSLSVTIDPAEVAGVLIPAPGSPLPGKVVGPASAALFVRLQTPGPGAGVPADLLAGLVLDGVLEIQTEAGFGSGPGMHELLLEPQAWPADGDRLSQLSLAGLRYAERAVRNGAGTPTARLYGFGRVPLSGRWDHAYPGPEAVLDLLRSGAAEQHWRWPDGTRWPGSGWLFFSRSQTYPPASPQDLPYKLYLSPHVDELADVLPAAMTALSGTSAGWFKVGPDAAGLLRPDKFVIYLRDAAEVRAVAAELSRALAGARPHGVPFSATLAGDGLLSWSGDPPQDAGPADTTPESWRWSVCRRLAEHLAAAQAAGLRSLSPARYALARLAIDGVSLPSFAPAALPSPLEET